MKTIFNPLSEDYESTYDINGDGNPVAYSIPSMGFLEIENEAMAEHCVNNLAKTVVFQRRIKTNFQDEYEKARKEIVV